MTNQTNEGLAARLAHAAAELSSSGNESPDFEAIAARVQRAARRGRIVEVGGRAFALAAAVAAVVTLVAVSRTPPTGPFASSTPSASAAPAVCDYHHPPEGSIPARVSVVLSLSTTSVVSGEPVMMTVTVRNDGSEAVKYETSAQKYEFWVTGPQGDVWVWTQAVALEAWPYAAGWPLPAIPVTLDPGNSRTASVQWDGTNCVNFTPIPSGEPTGPKPTPSPLPDGTYEVRAAWVADRTGPVDPAHYTNWWWSNPVTIEVR